MSLTPSAYLSTMDKFITHWNAVNSYLTGGPPPAGLPLTLNGNRTVISFSALRTTLAGQRTDVVGKGNLREIARADLMLKRTTAMARMDQFNNNVRSGWSGMAVEAALRPLPGMDDGGPLWEDALDDVYTLWGAINGLPAPVGIPLPLMLPALVTVSPVLPPTYSQALFLTDSGAVKAGHTALTQQTSN